LTRGAGRKETQDDNAAVAIPFLANFTCSTS
jgi:hypothetical protein